LAAQPALFEPTVAFRPQLIAQLIAQLTATIQVFLIDSLGQSATGATQGEQDRDKVQPPKKPARRGRRLKP
jgi:hypothetical protein